MNRLRVSFLGAVLFLVMATTSVLMTSHRSAAQNPNAGPDVHIVSPLPLPVTGSTTVSGTVAATQSGPWNVGIPGTISIKNLDEPGRSPYQQLVGFTAACFQGPPPSCLIEANFQAPAAGSRLVARRISGEIITNNEAGTSEAILGVIPNALAFVPVLVRSQVSSSETLLQFNQELLTYVEPGKTPNFGVTLPGVTSAKGQVVLSGYIVSLQ